jgi:hypothetical protein
MDIFEYLPQLIIAYDGNSDDKFANLIHISKAEKEKDYYCPCCGGNVKPRALSSTKEQSHYYHITGLCTKESQLHFFCKNWLFEKGSKFYIEDELFEVDYIEVEKTWNTKFGDYRPDVTVYTSTGEVIYFEMFFTNRKTGDDYFCKWNELENDVVEVNIKEYMYKTDVNEIPSFTYLYHDGKCYSKEYIKRDFYANTIQKLKNQITRKDLLNYKQRIEKLDWLWQYIMSEDQRDKVTETIKEMCYEDQVSCYEIIKKKNCVKYLKDDVLKIINDGIEEQARNELGLPKNDNVYFSLEHIKGRTYEAGIKLSIETQHISYNSILIHYNNWNINQFNSAKFPRIVFSKMVHTLEEISIPKEARSKFKYIYHETIEIGQKILDLETDLSKFEREQYKIRLKDGKYTVLAKIHDKNFEEVFSNHYLKDVFDLKDLEENIQYAIKEIHDKEYLESILKNEKHILMINDLKNHKNINCNITLKYEKNYYDYKCSGIRLKGYIDSHCIYDTMLDNNFEECIDGLRNCFGNFLSEYEVPLRLVDKINNCKNNLWKAIFSFSCGIPSVLIKINLKEIYESDEVSLCDCDFTSENAITLLLENTMRNIINYVEKYNDCRIFWEDDFNE